MVRAPIPALRGALCIRSRPISALSQRRLFGASARCLANEKQASFKSQLYESTQQRLKRERAEQERFAQYQPQSAGGRYAALMFGVSHGPRPDPGSR
jgi:D-lactate dehydrogenase (cytochrome)